MEPTVAIALVFIGCCFNVVFLELLVKEDPGSGNLITFSQFLFISIEGFIFTSRFGTKKPRIGLFDYFILVVMFFTVSVCNNYAFNFNIPMPLHMIFRAGSLIANMVMGMLILKKCYTPLKIVSILMITAGIIVCTLESGKEVKATDPKEVNSDPQTDYFWWVIGIILLTVALFMSARMGIYQEVLYVRHGKHPKEALFYTHLMPLPGFLLLYSDIWSHWLRALDSPALDVFGFTMPSTIVYLIGNVLTQYLCISSVYVLTTECSSLTVTLVVTLRKFLSLLFSIVYFQNEFTVSHWIGTILVFFGTAIFTELLQRTSAFFSTPAKKKD
ncbi:UDP-xylose and UDP-N-acetylglucosamine transporter [Neocloeon triangulifer]|uniref:UDP-xylose and UDP-N-acetylglucosamine transporter n=1 Tax=Neocloeon triangulifer TaxID=2078957 RepID=UPI00286F0F42|nr:UDP-xylose and UDP-N-acetylglucosamine transporter [Neocloeon triangulifer]